MSDQQEVEPAEDHGIFVHTHSYPDDSIVVELRPEEFDIPCERDMTRLSRENAEELRDQLDQALKSDDELQEAEE